MHILYFNTHVLMLKAITNYMNSTLHVAYACRFFLIPDINTMKIIIRKYSMYYNCTGYQRPVASFNY